MTKAAGTQLQHQPQRRPTLLYFGLGIGAYADNALSWKSYHMLAETGAQNRAALCRRPVYLMGWDLRVPAVQSQCLA